MKIAFIGGGNMASAIIGGITASGLYEKEEIFVFDINEKTVEKYINEGIDASTEIEGVMAADMIMLCVKPFVMPEVLKKLRSKRGDLKDKIFVSIAAGVSVSDIKIHIGFDAKVVRVMPNTPALIGEGMSVLVSNCYPATEEEFSKVKAIFDSVGKTLVMPENMISAVTSVSGSGPAYVFMMIEAMADAGVLGGLSRKDAVSLSAQTVLGAAKMVIDTEKHPAELKDMVCSPKGTTIEAVKVLEDNGFRGAVISAVDACRKKAENM